MSIPKACCNVPPVVSDYKPIGSTTTICGVEVYQVGEKTSKTALFCLYDIFGLHNNTYQVCDLLSEQGFYVVLPDFFRGKPWSKDNFPPKNMEEVKQFAMVTHSWPNTEEIIRIVLNALESETKYEKLGIFGFCWGGKRVFDALIEKNSLFKAGAGVHPSMVTDEDICSLKFPILTILSKGEAELLPKSNLLQNSVAGNSKWLDYTDQEHGFCASRGNFDDPQTKKRTTDAIQEMASFFKYTLG